MKQKKIGDILYVFEQTPYVITQDTDATVIKIQLEAVDGFKAINNSTINAKIEGYNYFLLTVQKQEWADYVDNYTITVAATTNGTCSVDKSDADPGDEVTITTTPAEGYELDTLTVMAGETPVTVTNSKFTMPAANVTVTATFKAAAVTLSPLWYDNGGHVNTELTLALYSQSVFSLKDTINNAIFAMTSIEDPDINYIEASIESSNTSIITVDWTGDNSENIMIYTTEEEGTATLTATWAQQTVGGVVYAAGSATIQIETVP